MHTPFKTIGIFGRLRRPGVKETLNMLIQYLQSLKQHIVIDAETAAFLDDNTLTCIAREELSKHCNLLIVVGGDGSLLHAVHSIINDEVPVLGINRGRLGFLTDVLPTELDKIKDILEGKFHLEKRFLFTCSVERDGQLLGQSNALNEVALIPDTVPHMNEFDIYIDDQFVCSQASDGLIVATPTGSTAYALSGGGPILHPKLDALVMVPMFPHTLSMRPIVIDANCRVNVVISKNNTATPRVSCDSQSFIKAPPGSNIIIQKKAQRLHLIHPLDYDYYASLRSKLHWGHYSGSR